MDRAQPTDERLLAEQLRSRKPDAAREFFENYRTAAYRIAMGILHRHADAMDVVQEAFIKAFRNVEHFEGRASLGTWFRRIVVNSALDALRARRARHELDAGENVEAIAAPVGPRREPPPDAAARSEELSAIIDDAVAKLPEQQHAVFALFTSGGLSYAETAAALDIPVGTVMSRLFHARRTLKRVLRERGYFEEES